MSRFVLIPLLSVAALAKRPAEPAGEALVTMWLAGQDAARNGCSSHGSRLRI